MIVDRLENANFYPLGPAWKKAFAFLQKLTPEVEEGRHAIQGDDIFALVSGYLSRSSAEAVLEAHRAYVDIQTLVAGREECAWFPAAKLVPEAPFDASKDVIFFQRPPSAPASIKLVPGIFCALFPQDAHMPGLIAGDRPEQCKKVVVKIKGELLLPSAG